MATKKKTAKVKLRDLAVSKPIKGGRQDDTSERIAKNHNEVFIR
jgi:hypothetical protein